MYKPKDIVAGDFYWMENIDDSIFIAAADSTGHGVPGAMVSVVCSNALNRSIFEFGLRDTGRILDKCRELVLETFSKSSSEVKDGMDISLLCLRKNKSEITWSGANNPLWYVQNNELKIITADKQAIGQTDKPSPFKTHCVEFIPNTVFYLITDGFPDQFGGPNGKKNKHKQLQEFLFSISDKEMSWQQQKLNDAFNDWRGNLLQVDDVCIVGVRI